MQVLKIGIERDIPVVLVDVPLKYAGGSGDFESGSVERRIITKETPVEISGKKKQIQVTVYPGSGSLQADTLIFPLGASVYSLEFDKSVIGCDPDDSRNEVIFTRQVRDFVTIGSHHLMTPKLLGSLLPR